MLLDWGVRDKPKGQSSESATCLKLLGENYYQPATLLQRPVTSRTKPTHYDLVQHAIVLEDLGKLCETLSPAFLP